MRHIGASNRAESGLKVCWTPEVWHAPCHNRRETMCGERQVAPAQPCSGASTPDNMSGLTDG